VEGRRSKSKLLLALAVVGLLGLGVIACGDASVRTRSAPRSSSSAVLGGNVAAATGSNGTQTPGHFKGDEDDDDTPSNYTGNNKNDNDADFDNDRKNENKGYYDSDDGGIRRYGNAADTANRRTIAALVKRYAAAVAANDGATACSMIYSVLVEAIPEDYGRPPGPAYLRGTTCQAVMSLLFRHSHSQLTGAIEVSGVRVKGNQAYALVGSRTVPASYIMVRREHGIWKIDELLAGPLP
jgi:hypothetical protein